MAALNISTDDVNDIRSNIIETLLQLFKKFEEGGEEVHLKFENKELHYVPKKGLWLEGCLDHIHVKDYRYGSVFLGDKIRAYHHLPLTWLKRLLNGELG